MPVRKITVTNAKLLELSQGINIVDSGHEITVDGKNVKRGFKLNAEVRYALARTGIVIKPLIESWKEANGKIFEAHEPKTITNDDGNESRQVPAENIPAYQDEVKELLAMPIDVELPFIDVKSLKVGDGKDENAIPATALTYLDPILTWPAEPAQSDEG